MKKVFALLLVMVMFAMGLAACSKKETPATDAPQATEAATVENTETAADSAADASTEDAANTEAAADDAAAAN